MRNIGLVVFTSTFKTEADAQRFNTSIHEGLIGEPEYESLEVEVSNTGNSVIISIGDEASRHMKVYVPCLISVAMAELIK